METIITAIVLGPASSAAYLSDGDFYAALLSSRRYADRHMQLHVPLDTHCLMLYSLCSILPAYYASPLEPFRLYCVHLFGFGHFSKWHVTSSMNSAVPGCAYST